MNKNQYKPSKFTDYLWVNYSRFYEHFRINLLKVTGQELDGDKFTTLLIAKRIILRNEGIYYNTSRPISDIMDNNKWIVERNVT